MNEVLAQREMIRVRPDGIKEKILIEIGVPGNASESLPSPLNQMFCCQVKITGVEKNPKTVSYYGVDKLMAICESLQGIGIFLAALPFAEEIEMSSLPNFGFPLSPVRVATEGIAVTPKQAELIRKSTGKEPGVPIVEASAIFKNTMYRPSISRETS